MFDCLFPSALVLARQCMLFQKILIIWLKKILLIMGYLCNTRVLEWPSTLDLLDHRMKTDSPDETCHTFSSFPKCPCVLTVSPRCSCSAIASLHRRPSLRSPLANRLELGAPAFSIAKTGVHHHPELPLQAQVTSNQPPTQPRTKIAGVRWRWTTEKGTK